MNLTEAANQLVGKPLVVYIDGDRRQIGTITRTEVRGDGIFIAATVDRGEDEPAEISGTIFDAIHDHA